LNEYDANSENPRVSIRALETPRRGALAVIVSPDARFRRLFFARVFL